MSKVKEYTDALNNYYTLKKKYENKYNIYQGCNKMATKDNNSKKNTVEDKDKKCIKCNKKGGTEFSRQVEKSSNGYTEVSLIAKCNSSTPCDLNINIKLANYKLYGDLVKSIRSQVETIKTDIIKLKLDLLFQLKDEDYVVTRFQKLKTKLQNLNKKLDKLKSTYKEKNDTFIIKKQNEDTKEEYDEKISRKQSIDITSKEIENTLSQYAKIVKEYTTTKNKAFLIDAYEKYHKKVVDLFKKKRSIQYQEGNIEIIKPIRKEDDEEVYITFNNVTTENKQVSLNAFQIVKNIY